MHGVKNEDKMPCSRERPEWNRHNKWSNKKVCDEVVVVRHEEIWTRNNWVGISGDALFHYGLCLWHPCPLSTTHLYCRLEKSSPPLPPPYAWVKEVSAHLLRLTNADIHLFILIIIASEMFTSFGLIHPAAYLIKSPTAWETRVHRESIEQWGSRTTPCSRWGVVDLNILQKDVSLLPWSRLL